MGNGTITLMKNFLSPGSLVTIAGATLTIVGIVAYLTGAANLSVPTLFYGFPIFLAGLALKTSELPPALEVNPKSNLTNLKKIAPKELSKLFKDVTRWKYGQKVHLESSLQALKLWDEENPPELREIEEMQVENGYAIRLRFNIAEVSLDRWEEKRERLGRFFAKGLEAQLISQGDSQIDLLLTPQKKDEGTNH